MSATKSIIEFHKNVKKYFIPEPGEKATSLFEASKTLFFMPYKNGDYTFLKGDYISGLRKEYEAKQKAVRNDMKEALSDTRGFMLAMGICNLGLHKVSDLFNWLAFTILLNLSIYIARPLATYFSSSDNEETPAGGLTA